MIYAGAMLGQTYVDMCVKKNPPRTSTTSGMGYSYSTLQENAIGNCA
jgi:hypothetical protein